MIRAGLHLFIILFLITISGPGGAQEEVIVMNHDELGPHERPLVEFPHLIHEDLYDCSQCHHDYDDAGVNVGSDGGYCSDCHAAKAIENPVPLLDAIHFQCLGCHAKEISTSDNKNIPQMCGQCHVRRDKAAVIANQKNN